MLLALRSRYFLLPLLLALSALTFFSLRTHIAPYIRRPAPPPTTDADNKPSRREQPLYKPAAPKPPPPLPEYFPLAASAKTAADLPPVPAWNRPPDPHVPEHTRLYIGFTRYWPLLQQVVVGYITAGWPPGDIYVVENTGTFDANRRGRLTSQNPFYLDYHRLTAVLGVHVMTTPSLQTFAQLQNLYLTEAVNHNLSYYFWAHMDTVPQSREDREDYKSLYAIAVDVIRESVDPGYLVKDDGGKGKWAVRFFSYDWLALVNTAAYLEIGGWDSMISYYGTDCDMHGRIYLNGFETPIADAGQVFDVGKSLPDLEVLYRRKKKSEMRKRENGASETVSSSEGGNFTLGETNTTSATSSATGGKSSPSVKPSARKNIKYLEDTEPDTLGSPAW